MRVFLALMAGLIIVATSLSAGGSRGADRQQFAALPQERGNVGQGHMVAEQICAQCHAVEPGQTHSPNSAAPAFPDIAASPGLTATAIRVWLRSPHPTMPNIVLNNKEKDNIVAYLLSLKTV
jgi:mono/diheme cytochrome c family protein